VLRPRADVLVSSQHRTTTLPQSWWSSAFATAIRDVGHTVLVLQPWHAPVPLTRSWCLWEIFSTLDAKARLEVVMPPAQAEALRVALDTQFDAISAALSQIDTRRAEAEKREDKNMVDAAVAASNRGFYGVNVIILWSLRMWLLKETREVAAARIAQHGATSTDALTARANLARLLGLLGHTAEAAVLCGELAAAATAAHGARSSQALASRGAHADALAANGELRAALMLLRAVMHDQEQLHAGQPEHVASQVAYARALVAYCACVARGVLEVHTPPHNIFGCITLFQALRACYLAFKPHRRILQQRPAREVPWQAWATVMLFLLVCLVVGPFVGTLNAADNFIVAWRSRRYLPEAVTLCRAAHTVLVCGGPTLEALSCLSLLGRALRDVGSLDEAEPLLCDAAKGLADLLGETHLHTMAVLADLADLLRERGGPGDLVVAEYIFRDQAPRLVEQLGPEHPEALCAYINIAICCAWRGDISTARRYLRYPGQVVRGGGDAPDAYGPGRLQYVATSALDNYSSWCWKKPDPEEIAVFFRKEVLDHLRVRRRRRSLLVFTGCFLLVAGMIVGEVIGLLAAGS
jgi:hypothetical protein